MQILTAIATAPAIAPTQELRDLIDQMGAGLVSEHEVHNALLKLEAELGLPMTTPAVWEG